MYQSCLQAQSSCCYTCTMNFSIVHAALGWQEEDHCCSHIDSVLQCRFVKSEDDHNQGLACRDMNDVGSIAAVVEPSKAQIVVG